MANLAFPLSRPPSNKPPSNRLPFALTRKLGELGESVAFVSPTTPTEPPKPQNPFGQLAAGCMSVATKSAKSVSVCHTDRHSSRHISREHTDYINTIHTLGQCMSVAVLPFYHLTNCQRGREIVPVTLANCQFMPPSPTAHLSSCGRVSTQKVVHEHGCVAVFSKRKHRFNACQTSTSVAMVHGQNCVSVWQQKSKQLNTCEQVTTEKATIVPCRFYPIPEPPPPPVVSVCQIRPPSDRLPFALRRKSHRTQGLSAQALPFALTCWHDLPPTATPNKRSYIVHNVITATVGGLQIDPLSFSIKTDMESFCWSGQVEITQKDFEKIKGKLDAERGKEPLITVNINNHPFAILCEDMSKNRSFVNHSYTLSGRSVTAHLSKDYANVVKLDSELYASQIVHEALRDLGIKAEFGVDDWLTHATMSDTPIAIIDEVAKACGGFIMSDKLDAKLYVCKRYKVPAWGLATTEPDRIIPLDVIKSISEQKRVNPRYNAVILTSNTDGAVVYRQREGQDKHAPVANHALYTDQACVIPAGVAILSDSGTHQSATIVMRWADKYNLPLAELGQVWQINDKVGNVDDTWRGIVRAVAVDVKVEDGVPSVWQTVEVDRYLDK